MFGLFKQAVFRDGQLGEFHRSGKYWKGNVALTPLGTFRLSLHGSRTEPDAALLALAKELPARVKHLMPTIENGLFEHYEPYKDAVDAGELTARPFPIVASPGAVWPHVTPAHVHIETIGVGHIPTVEMAFRVEWDVEHTVAAIFRDWQFIELNGSVRRQ